MNLFAERNTRIDTENAFKVGPHIVRVEKNINPVIEANSAIFDRYKNTINLSKKKQIN